MPLSVVVGGGVFIAPTTKVAIGDGCCRRAHRTVRCANHVTQPLGFDRWSFWQLGHRTVRWCTGQSLFTVRCAFWRLLWLCTCSPHCPPHCTLLQTTIGAVSRCSAWHTGQSGATPDSPVNYSGEHFPETQSRGVWSDSPWCTGHCPVAHRTVWCARPGQSSVFFAPLFWTLSFNFVLVCCEPLAPVELIV
jgi:hypothetical protein